MVNTDPKQKPQRNEPLGSSPEFKAPQLISFAMGQIEQDTIKNMVKNGKPK